MSFWFFQMPSINIVKHTPQQKRNKHSASQPASQPHTQPNRQHLGYDRRVTRTRRKTSPMSTRLDSTQSRAEQSSAEQSRAAQRRAEQSGAEQSNAEQSSSQINARRDADDARRIRDAVCMYMYSPISPITTQVLYEKCLIELGRYR